MNLQENEIIRAQNEAAKAIKANPENMNEKRLLMLAKAKRDWADLTDFEIERKCINQIDENELTNKKINIVVSE